MRALRAGAEITFLDIAPDTRRRYRRGHVWSQAPRPATARTYGRGDVWWCIPHDHLDHDVAPVLPVLQVRDLGLAADALGIGVETAQEISHELSGAVLVYDGRGGSPWRRLAEIGHALPVHRDVVTVELPDPEPGQLGYEDREDHHR